MKTINKKRATILTKIYGNPEEDDYAPEDFTDANELYAVNGLTRKLLQEIFTCISKGYCPDCGEYTFPRYRTTLDVGNALDANFSNFIGVIDDNFPDVECPDCNKSCQMDLDFGDFALIEVCFQKFKSFYFFLNFELRIQF